MKTENSTLPPIINAIEVYSVKNLLQSETDQEDGMYFTMHFIILVCKIAIEFYLPWIINLKILVGAITKIKSTYGVKRNWQGDPCAPQAYLWEGLNCSYDGYNAPRVISL